jgi:hypothetical protein
MKDFLARVLTPAQRSEWGRLLAAHRRRVQVTCPECGAPVEGTVRRRYCSPACRLRAARQRQRARPA